MKKLIIGCDADGVLTDMSKFNIENGKIFFRREPINPDAYSIKEMFNCSKLEELLYGFLYYPKYCKRCINRVDSDLVIQKLNFEGNRLYEITARKFATYNNPLGKYIRKLFENWTSKNNMQFERYEYCSESDSPRDKMIACNKLSVDIMIEDKSDVALYLADNGVKVLLFDAPYNKEVRHENIVRVKNWNEIYDIINEFSNSLSENQEFEILNGESENAIGYDINPTNIDIILSRCLNIISNENNNNYRIVKESFYYMLNKYNSYDAVLGQFNSCIAYNDFNYISRECRKALEAIGVDELKKNLDIITKEHLNKEKFNSKDNIDVTSTLVNSIDATIKKYNTNLDDKTLKYLRVDAIKKIMPDALNDNYGKITRELDARSNLEAIGSNAISVDLIKACVINKTSKFNYKSSFSKEEIDNAISNVLYQVENGNIENALLFLKDSKIQQILIENYAYTSSYTTKEQRDIIYKSSNIKNKDLLVSTQNEYMLNNQKTY